MRALSGSMEAGRGDGKGSGDRRAGEALRTMAGDMEEGIARFILEWWHGADLD